MACFVVPVTEAIVTTVVEKIVKNKELKSIERNVEVNTKSASSINFSTKLGWLNKMLWGGSALLAFEHVWHGEVVLQFPFLTAVKDGNIAELFNEMNSVGVLMALAVTLVWSGVVMYTNHIEKMNETDEEVSDLILREAVKGKENV